MTTHIDCTTCSVRGLHCHECVVAVLLGAPDDLVWEAEERAAVAALAAGGLVPPLRLVAGVDGPHRDTA